MAGQERRRGRGSGTAAAVAAVGLIALSGPVTGAAATLTAARTALPPAPASAAAPPAPVPAAVPAPGAPVAAEPVSAVAIPRPRPVDVRVRPGVPRGVPPVLEPPPASCGGYANPRRISPGVVPGVASATVGWQADGHTEVRRYRVQAVSQQLVPGPQPDPPAVLAPQPAGCGPVAVTVTGLASGVPYVFWLEEEVPDTSGGLRWVQVGTSPPTAIR